MHKKPCNFFMLKIYDFFMQKYHHLLIFLFLYCNSFVIYCACVKFASDARFYKKMLDILEKV